MAKRALIILDLQLSKFKKGLQEANKGWKKWSKSVLSVKNMLMAGFAGYGASQLIAFGKEAIGLAKVQADAEIRLAQAMKEKGVYTRYAFKELKNYASELQGITTIGDETTISSMAMLQAFGLTSEEMKKATVIAADFAASGKDMVRISELIGRAKTGETSMLSRYGVTMAEVAKKGGDFNAVLEVMGNLHRGEAAALRQTDLGKLDAIANAWSDIKDSIIGKGLAAGLAEVAKATVGGAEGMDKWVAANKEFMASQIAEYLLDTGAAIAQIVSLLAKAEAAARALAGPFKVLLDPIGTAKAAWRGEMPWERMWGGAAEAWKASGDISAMGGRMSQSADEARIQRMTRNTEIFEDALEKMADTMRRQSDRIKRNEDRASIGR